MPPSLPVSVLTKLSVLKCLFRSLFLDLLKLGTLSKKKRYYLGIFPNMGGGGLPKSQNFCKFTKYFFVCQIHSEVLKHVLQRGGGDI